MVRTTGVLNMIMMSFILDPVGDSRMAAHQLQPGVLRRSVDGLVRAV